MKAPVPRGQARLTALQAWEDASKLLRDLQRDPQPFWREIVESTYALQARLETLVAMLAGPEPERAAGPCSLCGGAGIAPTTPREICRCVREPLEALHQALRPR